MLSQRSIEAIRQVDHRWLDQTGVGSLQNSGEGGTANEATMSRRSLLDRARCPAREAARRSTKSAFQGNSLRYK
jgi:hypothetical protein